MAELQEVSLELQTTWEFQEGHCGAPGRYDGAGGQRERPDGQMSISQVVSVENEGLGGLGRAFKVRGFETLSMIKRMGSS